MTDVSAAEQTERMAEGFEGFRAAPYLCPAGVWTIGLGATYYLDGRPVKPGDSPISLDAARRLLQKQVRDIYQPGVLKQCPALRGGPLAAVTDFALNLGLTRLKGSTFRKKLLQGDTDAAKAEIVKWVRGGGRILPGLVIRRRMEARLL